MYVRKHIRCVRTMRRDGSLPQHFEHDYLYLYMHCTSRTNIPYCNTCARRMDSFTKLIKYVNTIASRLFGLINIPAQRYTLVVWLINFQREIRYFLATMLEFISLWKRCNKEHWPAKCCCVAQLEPTLKWMWSNYVFK